MPTPVQIQYLEVKGKYPDSLILFRMGDFYETFNEDAERAARILGITLTSRGLGENRQPMAGIPYHALPNYLPKLIAAGVKAVIVDQKSAAVPGQLVKREVSEIISPGVIIDESLLAQGENNYIAAVFQTKYQKQEIIPVVLADISTGEILATIISDETSNLEILRDLVAKYKVKELYLSTKLHQTYKHLFTKAYCPTVQLFNTGEDSEFKVEVAAREIKEALDLNSFKSWGISDDSPILGSLNALRRYLLDYYQKSLNLERFEILNTKSNVNIPNSTYRALEVFADSTGGINSCLSVHLDQTHTAVGKRLLRSWLLNISRDLAEINWRHDSVAQILKLIKSTETESQLLEFLKNQPDQQRFLSRLTIGRVGPSDLLALANGIEKLQTFQVKIKQELDLSQNTALNSVIEFKLGELVKIAQEYKQAIVPGFHQTVEPGFINPDYHSELKSITSQSENAKQFLQNLEKQEIEKTGISSLKVRYNKVFGYYIEISKSNVSKVPAHYIRKQTLVNAERYITDELKVWEEKVLNAYDYRLNLEKQIFAELVSKLGAEVCEQIYNLSELIAKLDVICGFALLAKAENYVRPAFEVGSEDRHFLQIEEMKHPVLAKILRDKYISNDLKFTSSDHVHLLTGPNMAGKSTYIRSVAILQLMAQLGSFVAAKSAILPIVDGIYTRVGASDNLSQNESTFMVEMVEMAYIMRQATSKSLVILDEVGRGTSTYDGVALAWSLVECLAQSIKAYTLFATHYHELTDLEKMLPGVANYYVEVVPGQRLVFTHKVKKGSLNKSFGVAVAKMAGISAKVIARATEIQHTLEKENRLKNAKSTQLNSQQLGFLSSVPLNSEHDVQVASENTLTLSAEDAAKLETFEKIRQLDLNNLTPMEAVYQLSQLLKQQA